MFDAHFFFLALAYVGTERRNPIFSFVNCPCDQEIDLVLSIPRARICIHLVPLFNVFFDPSISRFSDFQNSVPPLGQHAVRSHPNGANLPVLDRESQD